MSQGYRILSVGEYVYGGCNWNSGEYWRVSLSESIQYDDSMRFSQIKNKELGPFLPDKVSETGK